MRPQFNYAAFAAVMVFTASVANAQSPRTATPSAATAATSANVVLDVFDYRSIV